MTLVVLFTFQFVNLNYFRNQYASNYKFIPTHSINKYYVKNIMILDFKINVHISVCLNCFIFSTNSIILLHRVIRFVNIPLLIIINGNTLVNI